MGNGVWKVSLDGGEGAGKASLVDYIGWGGGYIRFFAPLWDLFGRIQSAKTVFDRLR